MAPLCLDEQDGVLGRMGIRRHAAVLGALMLGVCLSVGAGPAAAVVVTPVTPTIMTTASGPVAVGGKLYDTAALVGAPSPTGTVTFRLYFAFGAGDTSCVNMPAFTSTSTVSGGTAISSSFTATFGGNFRWTASYSGDATNAPATSSCGDAHEGVQVSRASPTLTTHASASTAAPGAQTSDTATISGAFNGEFAPCAILMPALPNSFCADSAPPPPAVVFALYGPDDAGCTGRPVFTARAPVDGIPPFSSERPSANGNYSSGPFRPTAPGTYRWAAVSVGDEANSPATSVCNSPSETVLVSGPMLNGLKIKPSRFRAAPAGPSIASSVGGTVSYRLSEAASVTIGVERGVPGQRAGGQCVRAKRVDRRTRQCTRYVTLPGSFTRPSQAGANSFRLRGRGLALGSYRLSAKGTDAYGNSTQTQSALFRIVKR